jgi:hypothetical protein
VVSGVYNLSGCDDGMTGAEDARGCRVTVLCNPRKRLESKRTTEERSEERGEERETEERDQDLSCLQVLTGSAYRASPSDDDLAARCQVKR